MGELSLGPLSFRPITRFRTDSLSFRTCSLRPCRWIVNGRYPLTAPFQDGLCSLSRISGVKSSRPGSIDRPRVVVAIPPRHRVDLPHPFGMGIFHMVGNANGFLLHDDDPIEVVKDEKPTEKEAAIPQGIRNP